MNHRPRPKAWAAWRSPATAALLVAVATGIGAALDRQVSTTSQAMLYLVAVVLVAYTCDRVTAVATAVAAVTAFNFFFVPPRTRSRSSTTST